MNAEQQEIFDVVKDGKNVLMLGMGGVGKSFTLHEIIQWANGRRIVSGVTATTGSAAILIQGTTLHSFLGIGLGTKTPVELADLVKTKKRFVYNRLRRLELLAIDEISMLDANLFDLISIFLGIVRDRQNVPFGGLQLILCGDLFQLPPVHGKFFFKSEVWPTMDIKIIELKESQRHKDDIEFMNILSELRQGKCTLEILKILKNTKHNVFPEDILPTLLYSKNMDVDSLNESKYNELIKTGARSFEYKLTYSSDVGKMWAQSCKIPESVKMCVGAQVVLTWNIDLSQGLCNGARGIVTDIGMSGVTVKFASGIEVLIIPIRVENEDTKYVDHNKRVWINFMPLRLAYALTINKSQGMTLDCAIVVLDKHIGNDEFMYGRAYTALSRVRNLHNIQVMNPSIGAFVAHPDVLTFYENI